MSTTTSHRGSSRTFRRGKSHSSRGSFSTKKRSSRSNYKSNGGWKNRGRKIPTFNPSQFINKTPSKPIIEEYIPKHTFNDFGLNKNIVQSVTELGIITPTPIQDQIIPKIMEGSDVVGLADTGTGKTAAFLLPLIEKALKDNKQKTLILAPTRELAIQINDELQKFKKNLKIFSTVCVGGTHIRPQLVSLRRLNHFIIGTPGRILDHIDRGAIQPKQIHTIVLDEADQMLDMGFVHDIKKIISTIPKERQTIFFSATTNSSTEKIVTEFLNNPVKVSVKKQDLSNSIIQDIVHYKKEDKFTKLVELLSLDEFEKIIVFGGMKHSVQKISDDLSSLGIRAQAIHGNKSQQQRQKALRAFKDGHAHVLVATDIAARGIHVDDISHVINYDLPQTLEDYTHRIGRTGRGDKTGKALTFVLQK